jgi:hypothetical protein
MPRKSEFLLWKILEPWYNLSSETEVMLWKPEMWIHISENQIRFLNLLFLIDSSILKSVDFLFHYKTSV